MTEPGLPLVSVLFITYKRFDYLKRTFDAFLENTDYPNLELVIADDGSGPEIQDKIRQLPAHRFALAPKNRGLGANNNAGLRLCTGKYVLMVQEDHVCCGPRNYLREAVGVMEANPDVGIINFCGSPNPPDLSMRLAGSTEPCYLTPRPYEFGQSKYFLYSDQAHLRSMESVRAVGLYSELRDMERCEVDYSWRWEKQTQFKTATFPAYFHTLFRHDLSAPSFRANKFRYRAMKPLFSTAQWLKRHCRPVYRLTRACYYGFVRLLEDLHIVR